MEIFTYNFTQRALIAGFLISIISSIIGLYLIYRRMTFMSAGISHAVFGGLSIGYLLGINMTLTAIIFTLLLIWSIPYIVRRSKLQQEIPIGIFYSSSMALGALLLSFHKGYTTDLFSFLFGSILSVKEEDLILTLIFTIVILIFFIKNYWKIIFIIFDKETAEASGLNVYKIEKWILTLTGIAIVLTSKLVGIILSSALIIIPAATVIPFTKDIKKSVFAAISLNLISIFSGLIFSYYFNIPTGATIVMVATIFFLISLFIKKNTNH